MSLQNSNISLRINGTFTYMQITHTVGTDAPPYHHRGWFFYFSLVTVWMVFFIFGMYNPISKLKCGLVWLENTFPLSFGPSRMTSGPEKLGGVFCAKINKCLPLCIIQFLFLHAAADCVEWQWFSKVLPSPCGYVPSFLALRFSLTIPPEGSMVTRIQQQFQLLAFMHWLFPRLPESFHDIMNCGWWKN